jgi:hypothetical protein
VRTGVYSWGGVWIVVVLGGGWGVGRRGWCAYGIAWMVFKCIMCLGVWLAIECDAVGGGKCVSFILILLGVHTWSFCSGGNCVGSGGVKTCCSCGSHYWTGCAFLGVVEGERTSLTKGLASLAFCLGMSWPLCLRLVMYSCLYGRGREGFVTGFIMCMVQSMGPYSCWFCRIWRAYAEHGSLFLMYLICS